MPGSFLCDGKSLIINVVYLKHTHTLKRGSVKTCLKRGSLSILAAILRIYGTVIYWEGLVPKYTTIMTAINTTINTGRVVVKNCCFTAKFSCLIFRFPALVSFLTGPFSCRTMVLRCSSN